MLHKNYFYLANAFTGRNFSNFPFCILSQSIEHLIKAKKVRNFLPSNHVMSNRVFVAYRVFIFTNTSIPLVKMQGMPA